MKIKNKLAVMAASLMAIALPQTSMAAGQMLTEATCPNYFAKAINPFTPCFGSRFPFKIAGIKLIPGTGRGDPPGSHSSATCRCGKFPGIPRGYWHPTRLVDVSVNSACSPSVGNLPQTQAFLRTAGLLTSIKYGGGVEDTTGVAKPQNGFFHVHSWRYPDYVVGGFSGLNTWVKGGFYEGTMTNPFWGSNDPLTANWLFPEVAALLGVEGSGVGGLFSMAAQAASCTAETTGIGQLLTDNAYWLGGCMENALPTIGHTSSSGNTIQAHATVLMRYLNQSNRMGGFASKKNVGPSAWCGAHDVPFPSKSEFKVAMLAPYAEGSGVTLDPSAATSIAAGSASTGFSMGSVVSFFGIGSSCDHNMGASEYRWGLGKSDQSSRTGDENASYLIWRWVDSCKTIF